MDFKAQDIEIKLDKAALDKIVSFMAIRQMTGNVVGPDYQFIMCVLTGLRDGAYEIRITGEILDKLDKKSGVIK